MEKPHSEGKIQGWPGLRGSMEREDCNRFERSGHQDLVNDYLWKEKTNNLQIGLRRPQDGTPFLSREAVAHGRVQS